MESLQSSRCIDGTCLGIMAEERLPLPVMDILVRFVLVLTLVLVLGLDMGWLVPVLFFLVGGIITD